MQGLDVIKDAIDLTNELEWRMRVYGLEETVLRKDCTIVVPKSATCDVPSPTGGDSTGDSATSGSGGDSSHSAEAAPMITPSIMERCKVTVGRSRKDASS